MEACAEIDCYRNIIQLDETCFREESADSDCNYFSWDYHSRHYGMMGRQCNIMADDAESTTSDNCMEEELEREYCSKGGAFLENYISYLLEASDDELGLPPKPQTSKDEVKLFEYPGFVEERASETLAFDFDLDLDLCDVFAED